MGIKRRKVIYFLLLSALGILFAGLFFLHYLIAKDVEEQETEWKEYARHYAFISDSDYEEEIWKNIYNGAKDCGEENDAYVEWIGKNLVQSYSKQELMEMAVASGVDGIIVEGDDSSEMNELINQAVENGIPVVTVLKDCYGSCRQAFVGIGSYNLGQEYGKLLMQKKGVQERSVLVIINGNSADHSEMLAYTGFREQLSAITNDDMKIDTMIVDGTSSYSIEEEVRNLLVDTVQMPDFIVCLDEQTTENVAQLVVDYNRVGQSRIIGFYESDNILSSIESGVLEASITLDAQEMGSMSVQALEEYFRTGYVSDYIPIETEEITLENVMKYKTDAGEDGL